jgi:hypothetical protein
MAGSERFAMHHAVEIENIEELRRRQDIDDPDLREAIKALRAGDQVRLTFLNNASPGRSDTVLVRVTSIKRTVYRGRLLASPIGLGTPGPRAGDLVMFGREHIHSVVRPQPARR